jgi:PPOX class probable F420-dependent enzyme
MELDEAREFIRTQHRAVLGTYRSNGTPQLSPVTVNVDGEGYVVISTRQTAYKVRNLHRDSRAYLCVFPDAFYGRWIQVDGEVTIVDLPEAMEGLVDFYRRTDGEHADWDEYRTAMVREQRVLLRMRIDRAGPDRSG